MTTDDLLHNGGLFQRYDDHLTTATLLLYH